MKNNWKSLLLLLFALPFLTFSCSEDDNLPKPKSDNNSGTKTEVNANANPTTNSAYSRFEFPHIKNDGNNLVIVHSTKEYGINYSVEWDCTKKAQRWTCYEMDASNSAINWKRSQWEGTSWGR
jgi:endonuclease G